MAENYIYQTIHTIAHYPLHVHSHCRILERAFMEVYFRPLILDAEQITRDITELLRSKRLSSEVSIFVELRVDIDFHVEIVVSEVSIYDGYSVRCISPTAECVTFDSPFGLYPSSARREVLRFAEDIARNFGGELAIECDRSGGVISGGGGALFGVAARQLISTEGIDSVERELVKEAAKECGIEVVESHINRRELVQFDELFIADHYGITSISRCGERYYIPIIAEKIAERLSKPWH